MIDRRRERIVLDSLQDLIRHMGAIREGRTAVITVSDGWALFAPDPSMTLLRTDDRGKQADPIPGSAAAGRRRARRHADDAHQQRRPQPVRTGPSARRTAPSSRWPTTSKVFKDLFGEANRANVSFYPIDPRGLPTFDSPIGRRTCRVVQTAYAAADPPIESLQRWR